MILYLGCQMQKQTLTSSPYSVSQFAPIVHMLHQHLGTQHPQKLWFPISPEVLAFLYPPMGLTVCILCGFLPPGPMLPFSAPAYLSALYNVPPSGSLDP